MAKSSKVKSTTGGIKLICENKKAFHNYQIQEKVEAGIVLQGTEVKALRTGKANIRDSYAIFKNHELFLLNAHISPYAMGNRMNHEPMRTRKLLMKKKELEKLWGQKEIKQLNFVPLKMYFKKGVAKLEIGIGKSKKAHDKRQASRDKEVKREMDRAVKHDR